MSYTTIECYLEMGKRIVEKEQQRQEDLAHMCAKLERSHIRAVTRGIAPKARRYYASKVLYMVEKIENPLTLVLEISVQ